MREKIVLGRRAVPKRVRLPDGTSFVARYERISRSSLPGNIRVARTRTVGPRNRRAPRIKKKRVRFNLGNTPTQDGQKNKKKYRRLQLGKGLASTVANLGLTMGSKAINSVLGKRELKVYLTQLNLVRRK